MFYIQPVIKLSSSTYLLTSSTMATISSRLTLNTSYLSCHTTQYNHQGNVLYTSQATLHISTKPSELPQSSLYGRLFTWLLPLGILALLVTLIGET